MLSHDEGSVMRPPLKGKSTPIPNSNLKQKKEKEQETKKGKAQDGNKKKRTDIKIIENIQLRPPREEVKKDEFNKDEKNTEVNKDEENMEW